MATYTSDGRLGKLLQRGRELLALAFAGDPCRPAILNFLSGVRCSSHTSSTFPATSSTM